MALTLRGARDVSPVASWPSGQVHYYYGDSPAAWRTGVPTFGRVTYAGAYPGIDVVYYGNQRRLEYDFVVAPGADWRTIRLAFDGVDRVAVDESTGELLLHVGDRVVRQPRPFTYQGHRDAPEDVPSRYVIAADGSVGFDVAPHDATRPLVIDPVIVYSSFLGGTGDDTAYDVAVDTTGAAYIVGETGSANFPTGVPHNGSVRWRHQCLHRQAESRRQRAGLHHVPRRLQQRPGHSHRHRCDGERLHRRAGQ